MVDSRFIKFLSIIFYLFLAACSTVSETDTDKPTPVVDRSVSEEPVKPSQLEQKQVTPSVQPNKTHTPELQAAEVFSEPDIEEDKTIENNPAVVALLENADIYEASGDIQQAEATLERAIRIDPKNPVLWQRLGYIRLHEKKWQQAIAMAQKSNTLAADNSKLQLANWKIIFQASKAYGNKDLLKHANQMIKSLNN